jgi:hypothetical protein
MTLVSLANNIGSDTDLFSGEGHLYRLLTREALELVLRGTLLFQCNESNYIILLQISIL